MSHLGIRLYSIIIRNRVLYRPSHRLLGWDDELAAGELAQGLLGWESEDEASIVYEISVGE